MNSYGKYNGQEVSIITISDGIEVTIATLGATICDIAVPAGDSLKVHVALGMPDAESLAKYGSYMGSVVGRCGNRISGGGFTLDGKRYELFNNDGLAHLHGGKNGFNKKIFDIVDATSDSVTLTCKSPDGEEGYPGNLELTVKYTVVGTRLAIEYMAHCDQDTVFSPTNHAYFNLNGEGNGDVLGHVMQIYADKYTTVKQNLIPTGIASVEGTPFDFRSGKTIGQDINADNEQLKIAGGFDHNFCLSGEHAATVYSPVTGITMDVFTDRPGVQFYSGNFMNNMPGNHVYNKRDGFCLETQNYPDAINNPSFPSAVLKKDEEFYSKTEYVFSIK